MSFIRPEIAAQLIKWREPLIYVLVLVIGLLMTQAPGLVVKAVGGVAALAGLGLGAISYRRVRFGTEDDAPGVVSVDERAITYMGPVSGGTIALDALTVLRLRREGARRAWFLLSEDGNGLAIPHGATGEDLLFDAFAALPGLRMTQLLKALEEGPDGSFVVWQRTGHGAPERLTSASRRDTS